jgi:hypothetical protein
VFETHLLDEGLVQSKLFRHCWQTPEMQYGLPLNCVQSLLLKQLVQDQVVVEQCEALGFVQSVSVEQAEQTPLIHLGNEGIRLSQS